MKKAFFLLFVVFLVGCSKYQDLLPSSYMNAEGQTIKIEMVATEKAYCGTQKIYSFASGNDLLISVVADSLPNGSFQAGLNWWNHLEENITLTRNGNSFRFSGPKTSGQFQIH